MNGKTLHSYGAALNMLVDIGMIGLVLDYTMANEE